MNAHVMAFYMDVCERCGATGVDIVEGAASTECAAPPNVASLKAAAMKRDIEKIIAPVLDRMGL